MSSFNPFAEPEAELPAQRGRLNSNPFEEDDSGVASAPAPPALSNNPFDEVEDDGAVDVADAPDDDDTPKWLRTAASEVGVGPTTAPAVVPAPAAAESSVNPFARPAESEVNPFARPAESEANPFARPAVGEVNPFAIAADAEPAPVSYTHLTLPTTPYV